MKNTYEIKFMQNAGFDIVRKIVICFVGFCAGAGCSYTRFDKSLSYLFFFCAVVLYIFNIKLKAESKMFKWYNRRFAYLCGLPCVFIFSGFAVTFFIEKSIEGGIGFSVVAALTMLLTLYYKRFAKKIPIDEKV